MSKRSSPKPVLQVAGPGAGKTHKMVERIVAVLPALPRSRFLAGITFTNAAKNSILERLNHATDVGPNVFIGTFHSFANRFIVAPFSYVNGSLPNERIYGGIDVIELVDELERRSGKKFSPQTRNYHRKRIVESLVKKGVVPYDEIIRLSNELLADERVRECVCRRLSFLFIDELQDSDTRHYELFEHIRKAGHTVIYSVGDPEQYVYSFTYHRRGLSAPQHENIPFFRFQKQSNHTLESVNKRSCQEIVDFMNHFRAEPQQHSEIGPRGQPRVLFIEANDLATIVRAFRDQSGRIPEAQRQRGRGLRLYLGYENATFDEVSAQFGIRRLSNGSKEHKTLLRSSLALLALCRGAPQRLVCQDLGITDHEWRKWGVEVLRELRDGNNVDLPSFAERWLPRLKVANFGQRSEAVANEFEDLQNAFLVQRQAQNGDWSSSIHQAKGLEGNAVLVVASSLGELQKWSETDRIKRNADKQDSCRLGFVAFSRAMELLCIACLKPLDNQARTHLQSLGVVFLPNA